MKQTKVDYQNESNEIRKLHEFANSRVKYTAENISVPEKRMVYSILKRSLDIVCALAGLLALAIPMLIIAMVIVIDSPGNPFFCQTRLGLNEEPFVLYKFRSMRLDAEKGGAQWAEKDDPRVTKVGKFLRKTRIDELPQLINILKGEMTLVGPRPERPEFYEVFDTYISGFRQRMLVKPGLTGFAQVSGGYSLMPEEKIVYDLEYIKKSSLYFDITLILKTVMVVIWGDKDRNKLSKIKQCNIVSEMENIEW